MKLIKELSDNVRTNIDEAREKIIRAYELKDCCPIASAWYKEMALAHIIFNANGNAAIAKCIADYKASDEYKENTEFADGMLAAWELMHADLTCKSAEVKAMIDSLK